MLDNWQDLLKRYKYELNPPCDRPVDQVHPPHLVRLSFDFSDDLLRRRLLLLRRISSYGIVRLEMTFLYDQKWH